MGFQSVVVRQFGLRRRCGRSLELRGVGESGRGICLWLGREFGSRHDGLLGIPTVQQAMAPDPSGRMVGCGADCSWSDRLGIHVYVDLALRL
jgi:hypothetical protein